MPQIQISVYLDDKIYPKYSIRKVEYNEIARSALLKAINKGVK